jgi:oxygen-independent coproporphyrinogen-3 oxidase
MSCYSLIYEPQTAMTARLRRGEISPIDESTDLAMFDHVYAKLRSHGFVRYETSNYALANTQANSPVPRTCDHNLIYWQGGNWLGFGAAAGSHIAGKTDQTAAWQWKNAPAIARYIDSLERGESPITELESLDRTKWCAQLAIFWLRLTEGLPYTEFAAHCGIDAKPILEQVLRPFRDQGLAELSPETARITEKGVAVSDHILKRVLAAFEQSR